MNDVINFIRSNNLKNILDIGANIGLWSMTLKRFVPDARIFMFEANPDCRPYLEKTGLSFDIVCLGKDSHTNVKLYKNAANPVCTGTSVYLENTQHFNESNYITVPTVALKDYGRKIPGNPSNDTDNVYFDFCGAFDYVKMDTQGSELDILRGCDPYMLAHTKFIQMEVSVKEYNKNAPLSGEVIKFMSGLNYVPIMKVEDHFHEGELIQEDWIFANKAVNRELSGVC